MKLLQKIPAAGIFILFHLAGFSQVSFTPGTTTNGTGGCGTIVNDLWSVTNNPAGTAMVNKAGGAVWAERRYNINQLSSGAFTGCFPLNKGKQGVLGVALYNFGSGASFQQTLFSIAYGINLSKGFSAGVALGLVNTRFSEIYGHSVIPYETIGVQYEIDSHTRLGLAFKNVYPVPVVEATEEKLPSTVSIGVKHQLDKKVSLVSELEHTIQKRSAVKAGIIYRPTTAFEIAAGFRSNPMSYHFAAGFYKKEIGIHLGFGIYPVLGPTPDISFGYRDQVIN